MRDWVKQLCYGWLLAIAMLLIQTVSSSLAYYDMSVYMNFFVRELDASLDAISLSVSLFFIYGSFSDPLGSTGSWHRDISSVRNDSQWPQNAER